MANGCRVDWLIFTPGRHVINWRTVAWYNMKRSSNHQLILVAAGPGPLKCLCLPPPILAKCLPKRNDDKADFATKVRKSSINRQNVNHERQLQRTCIEEAHWGGTFESNHRMFEAHFNPKKREIATFTWFATKARMLPAKCASSDSYVPPPMGAVGDTFEDRVGDGL